MIKIGLLPFERRKKEIIFKRREKTDEKFGFYPEKRPIEMFFDYGIIPLDKPKGPTSHEVSAHVQKILGLKKAGHSGTLDPAVTGVLPVALGAGTKIVHSLLSAGKEYVCLMHIHKDKEEKDIRNVMQSFVGRIKQMPPVKSAVKRELRYRKIYYIDILEIEDRDVLFKVGCQAGTYIRKLCTDIGNELGTGAHMQELRRTKTGGIKEFDDEGNFSLVTLQDVVDAFYYYKKGNEKYLRKVILPIEAGVNHLPKIWVLDSAVDTICHGASLKVPGVCKYESEIQVDDEIAVMSLKNELICTGKALMSSKQITESEKGIVVKPTRVFMERGVYPKN